jgi:hypothetical protein
MKLRIKGDSIRFRLTRTEVADLVGGGEVADRTRFPTGAALGYRVTADATAPAVAATFDAGVVTVRIPLDAVRAWAGSEEVTVRAELPLGDGSLVLLVEKDFPCTTPRAGVDDREALFDHRRSVEVP